MMVHWSYIGLVPYEKTYEMTERVRQRVIGQQAPDHLFLLQHRPVVTLGKSQKGSDDDLLLPRYEMEQKGVQIVQTNRGGKTTLHSPGQLVGYMVFDLKRRKLGIKDFVYKVADAISCMLNSYKVDVKIDEDLPGLYVEDKKIAFLGMNVRHGVTTHGFAINVNNDLRYFDMIISCGEKEGSVTSLANEFGELFSIFDVYWRFITCLSEQFGDEMEEIQIKDLDY